MSSRKVTPRQPRYILPTRMWSAMATKPELESHDSQNWSRNFKGHKQDGQHGTTSEDHAENGVDSNPGSTREKTVRSIFVRYAETCSMVGPAHINGSKTMYARVLWIIFTLVAMGMLTYHLVFLFTTYLEFEVKNEIKLGFSSLQFPAVTLCNVNPVRMSKLDLLSEQYQALVRGEDLRSRMENNTQAPENDPGTGHPRSRRESHHWDPGHDDYSGGYPDDDGTSSHYDDSDGYFYDGHFYHYYGDTDYFPNYEDYFEGWDPAWESEWEEDPSYVEDVRLTKSYSSVNRTARKAAGHQLQDMLLNCSFAGKKCYADNFTLTTSTTYGNCYTLSYEKFISRKSGPTGGLELTIYLELDEYVRNLTADSGLQVMLHPQKTMAFPSHEGLAVGGGAHTYLTMTLVQVERLGGPYSTCTSSAAFESQYKIKYTRQTCQKFCEQRTIHSRCNCADETQEDVNIIMQVESLKACKKKEEVRCMKKAYWDYSQGSVDCGCHNPCSDTKYEKMMSFRPWPDPSSLQKLVEWVCSSNKESCASLRAQSDTNQLADNFVKLNIFFEDLNYQNITERPDYEFVQFISDIGGTVGLWIGLSVLSIFEVFQLAVELLHFCFRRWHN